jgi:hypothetical protein
MISGAIIAGFSADLIRTSLVWCGRGVIMPLVGGRLKYDGYP